MKITRRVVSYDFPIPKKLTESEFLEAKKGLPIHPHINAEGELLKEYGGDLLLRSIFFWVPSGTFTSAFNYYSMLKKKKKFYKEYFDAIYLSNSYKEYSDKYDRINKK